LAGARRIGNIEAALVAGSIGGKRRLILDGVSRRATGELERAKFPTSALSMIVS
jgi:hypothetical protein